MFFDDSRPDRQKRARREGRVAPTFERMEIPPAKSYELLTPLELYSGGNRTMSFDTESYPNYFLAAFKCIETNKVIHFERDEYAWRINLEIVPFEIWRDTLSFVLHRFLLVGFNSGPYDTPVIQAALEGCSAETIKDISNKVISGEHPKYSLFLAKANHIDLIEVAPLEASLKIYGGRLHCERMQELPYYHLKTLSYPEICNVRDYCVNDLDVNILLYNELLPHIKLREELSKLYGTDLRSKSDAQVAEAIVLAELRKLGPVAKAPQWNEGDIIKYKVPNFIKFQTPQLQNVLEVVRNAEFRIGANGSTDTPECIAKLNINVGNCNYIMGNGGLHSTEKSVSYYANEFNYLVDRDVAGYYPAIILNQRLFPSHLGEAFLTVYQTLVTRRLKAKKDGNKTEADGLKIAVNGIFGKLGNKYSIVYSPDLVTQVTVTGQLCLLMLIEYIELNNIHIISANTDGIVINCPKDRYNDLENIIKSWEHQTNFITEETRYGSLHSRDVNNYIAIKEDGECKTKGVYCERGSALNSVLSKNPETLILSDSVQQFLSNGIAISETIINCKNFKRFTSLRTVKGGGEKNGLFLGKAIRWYYALSCEGPIKYVKSGNNVPKSEGAKPCMTLPTNIPDDLDYDWYINEADSILYDLGVKVRPENARLL